MRSALVFALAVTLVGSRPALGVLDDDQIAALLTYVRREWEHGFAPVTPEAVRQVRQETEKREDAWTVPELLKVQ